MWSPDSQAIIPIPHLVLHIIPLWLAGAIPKRTRVVGGIDGGDFADCPVVYLLKRFPSACCTASKGQTPELVSFFSAYFHRG